MKIDLVLHLVNISIICTSFSHKLSRTKHSLRQTYNHFPQHSFISLSTCWLKSMGSLAHSLPLFHSWFSSTLNCIVCIFMSNYIVCILMSTWWIPYTCMDKRERHKQKIQMNGKPKKLLYVPYKRKNRRKEMWLGKFYIWISSTLNYIVCIFVSTWWILNLHMHVQEREISRKYNWMGSTRSVICTV